MDIAARWIVRETDVVPRQKDPRSHALKPALPDRVCVPDHVDATPTLTHAAGNPDRFCRGCG